MASRASGIEIRTWRSRSSRTKRCSAFSISPPVELDREAAFSADCTVAASLGARVTARAAGPAEAAAAAVRGHLRLRRRRRARAAPVAGAVVAASWRPCSSLAARIARPSISPSSTAGRPGRDAGRRRARAPCPWPCPWPCPCSGTVAFGSTSRGSASSVRRTSRSYFTTTPPCPTAPRRQLLDPEHRQRARPVDRLGDPRRLAQLQLPDPAHDLHQLRGQRVGQAGVLGPDDLQLPLPPTGSRGTGAGSGA